MQTKHLCVLIHIRTKGEFGVVTLVLALLTVPRQFFFCGLYVLFMSCVCHTFTSVHCCLVVTCWERANLLALVCDV